VTNVKLARDYLDRSRKRMRALEVLLQEEAFPDVVRDSQEVVELLSKSSASGRSTPSGSPARRTSAGRAG